MGRRDARSSGNTRNATDFGRRHTTEHTADSHRDRDDTSSRQLGRRPSRRDLLKLAGATATPLLTGCLQRFHGEKARDDEGTITITPSDGLIDDPIDVLLTNFEPNERVTVRAHTTDSHGQTWLSFGRFTTDDDGTLSLARQAPSAGTYETADPMGLLWSMRVPGGSTESFTANEHYTVHVSVQRSTTTIASTTIERRFIDPDVVEHPIDEDGLVGVLFTPPGAGPHPAVLGLHGTDGQVPWLLGALLASHGYATLALQYFDRTGKTGLPTSLVEIPLEYFERAIDWLLARPTVTGNQVGVIGPSIGGELALLLGATLSQIGVVVGYVPSSLVWEGPGGDQPMWTYERTAVPFVPLEINRDIVPDLMGAASAGIRGQPVRVADLFVPSFDDLDDEAVEAGSIPVENIDGPVLLLSGNDDGVWPSTTFSEIAVRRLDRHDHPYRYEHHAYENAGHIISVPYQPTANWDTFELVPGLSLQAGGTASGNAHATADSWPRVLEFLAEGLR